MIELLRKLPDAEYFDGFPLVEELAGHLQYGLMDMIDRQADVDDIKQISDAIEKHRASVPSDIIAAIDRAVVREFEEISERTAEFDSEATVSDHMAYLDILGSRAGISILTIAMAKKTIKQRIEAIAEEVIPADAPEISREKRESETFDDAAIENLFATLLVR